MRIFTPSISHYLFNSLKNLSILLLIILSVHQIKAEGTKQINPNATDKTNLNINRAGLGIPFASWDCPDDYRLNIKICNPNEKIYMAFQSDINNAYFRIKDPSGAIVVPATKIPTSAGVGYMASYAQAIAGPQQLGIAGGYNAFVFDPAGVQGDYSIEFNAGSGVFNNSEFGIRLFDITVADGPAASNIKLGRLWSKDWQLDTQSYTNRFRGTMYVYANDGIVTNINFNGMQPYKFHISCNSKGVTNTGNFASDRMSVIGNQTFPEYKIFLNDPDNVCYQTGTFGNINGPIKVSGCAPNYCINIKIKDKAGLIGVILDLNGTPGYQLNSKDISLSFNAVIGDNCIPWDGKDGQGNTVLSGTNFNIQVDFFNGLTNLPLYDVEEHDNGFIVSLVRPSTGSVPKLFWDDTQITSGTAVDGVQNLAGCTPAGTNGCHKWADRGINSGPGSPPESINTWWYANIQTQQISFSSLQIDVDADATQPGKGAGNAKTVCGDGSAIPLNASKIGPDATTWATNGTGIFTNTNTLNPSYTPSAADLTSGSVKLTITTSGASCPTATDFIPVTLQPVPKVSAGGTINVCENSPNAQLAGSVQNGVTGIQWTGGSGSYAPNNTTLNAIYTPSAAEITAGTVTLTLTSTAGNGVCAAATGSVTINITKAPIVDAGTSTTLCANKPTVTLAGNLGNGAINPKWSGGAGVFADKNSVNTTYTPTAGEISAGTVTLNLTADKANCNSVTKNVIITFTPTPTVNAGPNQTVCTNNAAGIKLNGTSSAAAVQWIGGTGTFSPDRSTKNATYNPSAAEIADSATSISLTLQTVNSGACSAVSSSPMLIKFTPRPTVYAGEDINTCSNNPSTKLVGVITGATGATWTGPGGSFTPSNTVLSTSYLATLAEIGDGTGGFTTLTLTTTGNGKCLPVSDLVNIIFDPNPTADAGPDVKICKNNLTVQLTGATENNNIQTWTTSGTGTFNNVNLLNAIYTPSQADTAGNVTLTLKSNRTPACKEVSDAMIVSFTNKPKVNAGADISICDNNPVAALNGFSSTGTGTWSGGTGTFTGNTYKATAAEASAGTPITLTFTSANNGTCGPVSDDLTVSFYKAPTVNAGTDQSICSNNININLKGTSTTNAGRWMGGNGTFSPDTISLNVSYIPTAAEITAGSVTLTFKSRNNTGCLPVTDNVKISFTPKPAITLANTQSSCANKSTVSLTATVTNATGGIWSNGGGTFGSIPSSLTNTYTPSSSEIQKGKAVIKLTTTGNDKCNPVTDSVVINIVPAPIVNAGADQVVCGDVTTVNLVGKVTNGTGGTWTKAAPATGTFANANAVSTTYTPSAADIDSGYVKLNFTSTGIGTCQAVNDTVRIFFTAVPTINAGPDQTVCTNDFPVKLNAFGSPGSWSGGAGTYAPAATALNATYTPTAAEISSGTLNFTFTTTASATCASKKDQVKITIKAAPIVDAGGQVSSCNNSAGIPLDGTVTNATGGKWSTLGTGTFTPNTTTLNAQYVPSTNDINIENFKLVLTSTGNGFCPAVTDTLTVDLQAAPVVNAGPDQSYCANNATIQLNGVMQSISGLGGLWTGGAGTFTPNNKVPNTKYTPTAGEIASGTITLTYSSVSNGICPVKSDDVTFTFTPAPTTNAGSDKAICESAVPVSLTASSTLATTGFWTSLGGGSFAPSNIGNTTSYFPAASDISTGAVDVVFETSNNGNCLAVKDTVHIDFTLLPVADAGKDTTLCTDLGSYQLQGIINQASSLKWTSSGSGTFDDNTLANATYTPSAADKTGGSITLTLTAGGNGTCSNKSDKMVIKFAPVPVVTAGSNRSICADINSVSILGKITHAGGGNWISSGTGTFLNSDSLQTTYFPSTDDKAAGTVTLTLTSTLNGVCSPAVSSFTIKIDPVPTVNIGLDRTICADSNGINLTAAMTNATAVKWATNGSGSFSPNVNSASPLYIPSVTDRANGKVKLWATTSGSGSCNAVADTVDLTIIPAPVANAGTDISICKDHTSVSLTGTITNANGGLWTTSGTGTFNPDNTSLSTAYIPSANDKTSGNVILTLKSTGNGLCKTTGSQITVTFTPIPTVNAGNDKTFCSTLQSVNLGGSVKFGNTASTGQWTSLGGGSLLPDNTNLNAVYYPTATEVTNGKATLVLTSTNNGTCTAINDTVQYFFQKKPVVTAGPNDTICADMNSAALSATAVNAKNYSWSTLGTGSFSPSNLALNTNYIPAAADISAGKVDLIITTLNNGVCPASKDTLSVVINPTPTINVGPDVTVCTNLENINLIATISNAKGVKWTSSGSGAFSPTDTTLTPAYFFSTVDISVGNIVLTAVTTGNGLCKAVYADQVIVSFAPAPIVNAGPDITTCIGNGAIQLNGTITNSTVGGTWVTNGSGTFSNVNALNATYTPSAADEASGTTEITLVSNPTTNCQSFTDDFIITYNNAPVINAGKDSTYCTNGLPIQLQGSGASGKWSGGAGTFTPDASTLNATYTPTSAEITSGTITLTVSTNPGLCVVTTDNVTFKIKTGPTTNAGTNDAICANTPGGYALKGISNTSSAWTTANGEGTFVPNASDPNAHFIPSASQIANGNVTLILTTTNNTFGCPSESTDQVVLNITPAPIVNAGFDITTCIDVNSITLSGTKSAISTGVQWTTSSGNGSFAPQAVSTTFTPANADKAAGKVSVYLTTAGSGQCAEVSDTLDVVFTPAPTVFAGNDTTICASNAKAINLKGLVTVANGGIWTSAGSGTFAPDETVLKADYFPTTAEITAGSVSLTLTTTGNGACLPKSDGVTFTIQKPDTVNAGKDLVICSDNAAIPLSGQSSTANVKWTTNGTGTFTPDNQLATNFQPSAADKANGGITITLTTANVNSCPQTADYLSVKFNPTPVLIVNSGFDKVVCISDSTTQLNGFVVNAKGGKWSTSGNGTFVPSDTILDAFYVFGSSDKTGPTTITLTATGTGPCAPVSDNMKITYQAIPTVKVAQKSIPACADVDSINISATVVTATSGKWTTSGTGYFAPKADSLSTSYFPSKSDAGLGAIWLTVMSVNNGECGTAEDTVFVNFGPSPTIDAGPDKNICRSATSIVLTAKTTIATGGSWITSGAGTISPDNALTTSYAIVAGDSINDAVTMTVTSTGQGTCKPVSDQVTYTFDNNPTVNAGPDVLVCETNKGITLAGTVKNTDTFTWISTGSGTFTPDNKTLTAIYIPSSNDIQNTSVTLTLVTEKTNACTPVSDQMTLTFQKQATVVLTTDPACYTTKGIAISAAVTNATGGTWSTSGGGNFSPNNSVATGKYFFGFTDPTDPITLSFVTNPTVCPAVSASQVLKVNLPPSANAGKDEYVCQGNNITLSTNATSNFQYQWTDISNSTVVGTASFVTVNIPITKSYQLQVTDQNSCTGVDTVSVNAEKPVTFGLAASICLDPYFLINALPSAHNASGSFQWYKDGNLMQGLQDTSIYASEAGKYVITYNIGQCTSKDSAQVHALPIMVNKGKTACIGSVAGIKTTNIPAGSYTWKAPIAQVNSYMNNVNPVAADTNFYYVTGKDVNSCETTDSIRVIGVEKPILTLNDVDVCGDTITLDATPTNISKYAGFTVAYNWTKDKVDQNITTGKYFIKTKGQYIANVAIMDCKASDTANVTFNLVPTVSLADSAIFCNGSEKQIRLDAGYGTSLADTTGIKYLWSTNATTRVITANAAGKYYVTITTQGKCKASDTINVIGVQKPILALKDANLCIGDTITLHARPTNIGSFAGLPVTYNWSKDNVNQNKNTSTYFTDQSGKYIAVVNIRECQASDTATLKFNPLPVVSLVDTIKFCPNKKEIVTLDGGSAGIAGTKYLWTVTNLVQPSTQTFTSQIIKIDARSSVTLLVTDTNSCKASDAVFIKDLCAPQIFVPNAFTPGKPGKDKTFQVYGMYFKNFKITIYSRWGEVLFSSNSKDISWDGDYINQEMQYGVYPYIITYDAEDPSYPGGKIEGSVTLLR